MPKLPTLALLAALALSPVAQAAGAPSTYLSLVGLAGKAKPEGNHPVKDQVGAGGGFLLEFTGGFLGLETGLLYSQRKFSVAADGLDAQLKTYTLPVSLRLNLGPYLSLGGGGYFAKMPDLHSDSVDYGGLASVALHLPLANAVEFTVDGRCLFGSKQVRLGTGTYKFRDQQILAGLRFGF